MSDFKKRIENSINRFAEKSLPKDDREKRPKNKKPEAELRQEMLKELKKQGFLVLYVESQAVFSQASGRYLNSQVQPGTSDLLGCDHFGNFLAIELKAPGRLKTLKENQRMFLESVVKNSGFACCVDSIDSFLWIYRSWLKITSPPEAKRFLIEQLPARPKAAKKGDILEWD